MRRITFFKTLIVAIALVIGSTSVSAQIAAWDFTGLSSPATATATTFNANLVSTSSANTITRGVGAAASSASNSFRSTGFKNEAISTSNTDYFQITLSPSMGYTLSLSTIDAKFAGTASYCVTPGVSNQFAYSLDGTNFTLIGSAQLLVGTPATLTQIDVSAISALQNIAPGTTVTLRYYASGQTATGGWGFYSSASGQNGLAIGGYLDVTGAAKTPAFSVPAGKYVSTQSVVISSRTTGANIYYTTDGSTPDNTKTLYTGPINISSTTTINAIAYDSSNANPSATSSVTYTFPTAIADIATLRAASTSGFYQLTGQSLLTFQDAIGKVKFVQDGTAGIVIYDGAGTITTIYAIGDKIPSIYCTLSLYAGMLELIPFADPGAAASSGNAVTPIVVTLANLANYPGQLVTVKNVAITGTGNFVSATTYPINDGTVGVLRTAYSDLLYIGSAIPSTNQDITGVVNMYSVSEADLIPRTIADMIFSQTITSTATGGLWSSTGTWVGGVVPVPANDVVIADGATVTIDQAAASAATVASIRVGQGTSGTLLFDRTTGRALAVTGNVTVNTGGSFLSTDFTAITPTGDLTIGSLTITNVSSTTGIIAGMTVAGNNYQMSGATVASVTTNTIVLVAGAPTIAGTGVPLTIQLPAITQNMTIGGNLINNGTFDMSKATSTANASTTVCNVTFNSTTGDQTISGTTPVLTRFQGVTLTKAGISNKVVSTIDTYVGGGSFTLTTGTWNQHAGNLINSNGTKTLSSATGKLLIDGTAGYTNYVGSGYQFPQYTSGSLAVTGGTFEVNTSGKVQIGAGNNNITNTGGTINFLGGNIYVYGRIQLTAGNNTFSGANIYIDPNPSASSGTYMSSALLTSAAALGATSSAFEVSGTMTTGTASFNFSSGSVTLVNPNAAATTGRDLKITATGTGVSIKGGTIYIGDGTSTRASSTYKGFVNGSSTILWNNVIVQTGNTIGRNFSLLGTNLNFDGTGTLTISANGVLDCQAKAVLGTANTTFNLLSGATIKTSTATGINGVLATWTGTINLSTGANYEFDGPTASAVTGTLMPATVNSLIVNNATGVTLSQSTTAAGALTLTSGTLTLGANNLTVGSISGSSATKYVVTSGTGTLTQPVAAAGTVVFPIGASASSYDPVSVTPFSTTNFSAKVNSTLSGTAASGYTYNAREWNLGSSTASSTAIILTPSAVTASGINSIIGLYDGTNYVNVPATLATGAYSATVTSFPLIAVTGATDLGTGISATKLAGVTFDGQTIQNNANLDLQVYDVTGRKVVSSNKNINMNSNPNGIYIVKSQNGTLKITVTK